MKINSNFDIIATFFINCIYSILSITVMFFLTKWILKIVKNWNEKTKKIDPTLVPITLTVIKYSAFVITVLVVLNIYGANTNGIIALLGAAGLGLALALKDTLQNIASGIMLIFLRPFEINDSIECGNFTGVVQEINLFATTLKTPDGLFLFMPNNLLWNTALKNFTRNGTRRLDYNVGISYESQSEKAKKLILDYINSEQRVLKDPQPAIYTSILSESSVNVLLRCWIKVDDYWEVFYKLNSELKDIFDQNNISIPYPQREVHIKVTEESKKLLSKI